jgi:peptide/nickel transport system ATP-binding protein
LLSIRGLTVRYGVGTRAINAVDDVSLDVPAGAVLGLVGESGSGKSTLAKAIVGLEPPDSGTIDLDGESISEASRTARERRLQVQMVFQDPFSSLDPRMTIEQSLMEALTARRRLSRAASRAEIERLLDLVSLDGAVSAALPRQLSGGQLQRIAIARALAAQPRLLIADEITSSLDVSVQGAILNVIRDIRAALDLTMLFISHNVAVVRYLSDVIAVMYLGQIVESGPTEEVLANPQHPYTQVLLDSVPGVVHSGEAGHFLDGEPPDPHDPPPGCRFHPRCPVGPRVMPARTICETDDPCAAAPSRRNRAACHFVEWLRQSAPGVGPNLG